MARLKNVSGVTITMGPGGPKSDESWLPPGQTWTIKSQQERVVPNKALLESEALDRLLFEGKLTKLTDEEPPKLSAEAQALSSASPFSSGSVGPGTVNKIAKFGASGDTVGDSNISDDGINIEIAPTITPATYGTMMVMVGGVDGVRLTAKAAGAEIVYVFYGTNPLSPVPPYDPILAPEVAPDFKVGVRSGTSFLYDNYGPGPFTTQSLTDAINASGTYVTAAQITIGSGIEYQERQGAGIEAVNGQLKLNVSGQGDGKVLTSDGDGNASWVSSGTVSGALGQPANVRTVGAENCNHTSIKDAADYFAANPPTGSGLILVQQGEYFEAPFSLPPLVSIQGLGSVTIGRVIPGVCLPLITVTGASAITRAIVNVTIDFSSDNSGQAIYLDSSGALRLIQSVVTGGGCSLGGGFAAAAIHLTATAGTLNASASTITGASASALQNDGTASCFFRSCVLSGGTALNKATVLINGGTNNQFTSTSIIRTGGNAGYCIATQGAASTILLSGASFRTTGSFIGPSITVSTDSASQVGRAVAKGSPTARQSLIATDAQNVTWGDITSIPSLPVYVNNAAALVGGLGAGRIYRTGLDPDTVCVVH